MARRLWTPDEMTVVLDLYFKLPFGKLRSSTPEVKELAGILGRSDNAIAMRLANYASCDPYIIESGRKGLGDHVAMCMPYWEKYANDKSTLFLEAERIKARLKNISLDEELNLTPQDFTGRERETVIRQRVNQASFRTMILGNYEHKCAITGIDIPQLLVASHIVPWSHNAGHRLDPANGICLSPLYDKVFDGGLIGIREDYTIELSKDLKSNAGKEYFNAHFKSIENTRLTLPIEHIPDRHFLKYHYENIFTPHN